MSESFVPPVEADEFENTMTVAQLFVQLEKLVERFPDFPVRITGDRPLLTVTVMAAERMVIVGDHL